MTTIKNRNLSPDTNESLSGCNVDVVMGEGSDIWLHSYFLTGLIQLAQEKAISLRVTRDDDLARFLGCRGNRYPLLVLRCTTSGRGNSRVICFDPRDQSDAWQTDALEGCDLYFKRSTYQLDTDQLAESHRVKVRSINPMFAAWCPNDVGWTLRMHATFITTALHRIAARGSFKDAVQSLQRDIHCLATLSSLDQYEDTPASRKRKQVLFQTRLWDPAEEDGDWVEPCNQHRVEMVRTLRAKLGDRLVGGLIRTPYTEQHYSDLLSNLTPTAKAKRGEFIRLCRQFLVRVNIKALFDATPYSLGETLAANNCLVSETIRNSFATPLIDGRHYVGFTTADECAEKCKELLDSDEKTTPLREEAYAYYRSAVRPKESMQMFLKHAIS